VQLFVSYARPDRPRADTLAQRLRQAGFTTWLESGLLGGQQWWDRVLSQIRSCDALIAVMSRASISSQACHSEREYAVRLGKPVLPVVIEAIPLTLLPADVARIQVIDYTHPDEAAAFQLAGAIMALPKPWPLPDPLPAPPPAPHTGLGDLYDRVTAQSLTLEEQQGIISVLEGALDPAGEPDDRQAAAQTLAMMAGRPDLYAATARRIETLQAQARQPPDQHAAGTRFGDANDLIANARSLSFEEQLAIVGLLEGALQPASDPYGRQAAAEMLARLADRPDLYAATARRIETLQAQADQLAGQHVADSVHPPGSTHQQTAGYPAADQENFEAGPTRPSTSASSSRVFVSYRREDAGWAATSLFMQLVKRLGVGKVFHDVDSVQLGDDFVEAITTAVGSCAVLLAVIGDQWLASTDKQGRRRLDDPGDFVRLEIEAALTRNVRVIPVLVGTAPVPRPDELPASLAKLARRQALQLRPDHFESDIDPLLRMLANALAEEGTRPGQQPQPGEPVKAGAPTLYAPNPRAGPPGIAVTVPGAGLGSPWDSQLTLDGSPIAVTSWSANAIQFTVPASDPATNEPWLLPRAVQLAAVVMDQLSDPVAFMITP